MRNTVALLPGLVRRTWGRCAFATAAILFLAGCSSNAELSRGGRFDPAAQGLVVVGLRVVREPTIRSLFLDRDLRPVYELTMVRIAPDGRTTRDTPSVRLCDTERILLNGLFSGCEPGTMQYKVAAITPGRYVLGQLSFSYSGGGPGARVGAAAFSRSAVARAGTLEEHPERSFEVKPGEVVYIGDYTFAYPKYRARPDSTVGRDDEAARRALAAYPNLTGSLIYRPALGELVPGGNRPGIDLLVE